MASNTFRSRQFEDFTILNKEGNVLGDLRVKPNAVLWSPKGKQSWYSVKLDDFAEFAVTKGTKQTK